MGLKKTIVLLPLLSRNKWLKMILFQLYQVGSLLTMHFLRLGKLPKHRLEECRFIKDKNDKVIMIIKSSDYSSTIEYPFMVSTDVSSVMGTMGAFKTETKSQPESEQGALSSHPLSFFRNLRNQFRG